MKPRRLTLLLTTALLLAAPAVQAADIWEGTLHIAPGDTAATKLIDLAASGTQIDSIVVYNSGINTAAVIVAASDIGHYTTLETFATAAANGELKYPARAVLSYEQQHVVTGNVVIAKNNVISNYVPYVAQQLRVTAARPATNSYSVFTIRVYGR